MRKLFVAAATVAIFALLVSPAIGAPGGGRTVAKISFMGDSEVARTAWAPGNEVTFAVDPVGVKDRDLYHLWVANSCTQDGVNTYVEYLPVTYSSYRVGQAGAFTLSSPSWTSGYAECTAFVWNFSKGVTPLAGATLSYGVS
jgi:hypothetical protein